MPSIEKSVQWMIATANDDTHGYDQANRTGPDYDCSSFVSAGLKAGGFDISVSNTTRTLYTTLTKLGFKPVTDGTIKRGDIHLKSGYHVVCSINESQIVHASINENGSVTGGKTGDQTGKEICIRSYYTHSSGSWDYHLRYSGTDYDINSGHWISNNEYLNNSQMQNNAFLIYQYFKKQGWTINAIAGMLGNIEKESTINPGIWQGLNEGNTSGGYGLVQWTPATKITQWLSENGYSTDDGDSNGNGQCERIIYEMENGIQWISTEEYPLSFKEFSQSKMPSSYLALAFLYNYERPADLNQPERGVNAGKWFTYLSEEDAEESRKEIFRKRRYKFYLFKRRVNT